MADWKSPMRADPSEWLVLNATAPLKYRLLTELHALTTADPNVAKVRAEVLKWPAAKAELRFQRADGTWGGKITAGDPKKAERTTEKVLWCLCELTWDREVKEIRKTAKILKSLLSHAKKDFPLHEYKAQVKQDPIREKHAIWTLRITALALLLRAGYTDDRKILDLVADLLERVGGFVADPVSRHPVEHVGVGLPQIRREAMRDGFAFFPDLNALRVFAWCPQLLESARVRNSLKRVFDYVLAPDYQELGPEIGAIRTVRGAMARGGGIQLRPIEEYLEQGNLDELLFLLEQFARMGLINRYPQLMAYVEWLLAHQEKDGRWDLAQKHFGAKPLYAAWTRVEKDWKSPQRRIADVTFRMMVILKYQWERQIKMLDRGADMYGY
jgi:hypothetical protein